MHEGSGMLGLVCVRLAIALRRVGGQSEEKRLLTQFSPFSSAARVRDLRVHTHRLQHPPVRSFGPLRLAKLCEAARKVAGEEGAVSFHGRFPPYPPTPSLAAEWPSRASPLLFSCDQLLLLLYRENGYGEVAVVPSGDVGDVPRGVDECEA